MNHSSDGCGVTTPTAPITSAGAGSPRDLTAAHTLQSALMADEAILMWLAIRPAAVASPVHGRWDVWVFIARYC